MDGFRTVHVLGGFALGGALLLGGVLSWGLNSFPTAHSAHTTGLQSTVRTTSAGAPPSQSRAGFDTLRGVSRHIFRYTNETRRGRSLPALRRDSMLAAVACAHNGDMFRRDFFRHVNPDGEQPHDRVARLHRRLVGGVGENLYEQIRPQTPPKPLAQRIVKEWMGSPPHRKNIIRPHLTHLGVCVFHRNDSLRATQVFANVSAYLSSPLPRTAPRGTRLPASVGATFPPDATPVRYDFWDADRDRIVAGPYVFTDSLRIPDTTGTVWSRFYVLETGRYTIQHGPKITITSP